MLAYFDGSHTDGDDVGVAVDGLNMDLPDLDAPLSDAAEFGSVFAGLEPHDFDGSDFDRSNVSSALNWKADSVHQDTERRQQRDRRRERLVAFEISARTAHLFRHATRS